VVTKPIRKKKIKEIDVERINIVEKDGRLRMVISNSERYPAPMLQGKVIGKRQVKWGGGIIFYNDEQDECGGLGFGGGRQGAGAGLFFDQYKQDQIVGLFYNEGEGQRLYGLQIWDRPEAPITRILEEIKEMEAKGMSRDEMWEIMERRGLNAKTRIFVGRTPAGEALVSLRDRQGRERIRILVDDAPRLEFLNEQGVVVYKLPPGS